MLRKLYPSPVAFDRIEKVIKIPVNGNTLHALTTQSWINPESGPIIVTKVLFDVLTVATGAGTMDIGYTATSGTTSVDTMLDGIDINGAIALFDSSNAALDSGANAQAQTVAKGKWVTFTEKTGDATGMVANLYIHYLVK